MSQKLNHSHKISISSSVYDTIAVIFYTSVHLCIYIVSHKPKQAGYQIYFIVLYFCVICVFDM